MEFRNIESVSDKLKYKPMLQNPRFYNNIIGSQASALSESQVEIDFRRENSQDQSEEGFFNGGANIQQPISSQFASQPLNTNKSTAYEFLLNLKQELHSQQLQNQDLIECLNQANQKLEDGLQQKECILEQLKQSQLCQVEEQRKLSILKSSLLLISQNLTHLIDDTDLAADQHIIINDCLVKCEAVKIIDVPMFETNHADNKEMDQLINLIQLQLDHQNQIQVSPSQLAITMRQNLMKINSSSSRAIIGIGSKSKGFTEPVKTIEECNIEVDDEHSSVQTLQRQQTFAELNPMFDSITRQFQRLTHLINQHSQESSNRVDLISDQNKLLTLDLINNKKDLAVIKKTTFELKTENQILQRDCAQLIKQNQDFQSALVHQKQLVNQSNKLIDTLRNQLKENQEKLKQIRTDYAKLNDENVFQSEVNSNELKRQSAMQQQSYKQLISENQQLKDKIQKLQSKLEFELQESQYKLAQKQLQQIPEKENKDLENELKQTRLQLQTVTEQKNVYQDISQWTGKENPRAKMMMEFVHYLHNILPVISQEKYQVLSALLEQSNQKIIFEYEAKLQSQNALLTKLKSQLKLYLSEMMQIAKAQKDPKLERLKHDDKILSQYLLEEECKTNVFDWIRDFKDFEIREELKSKLKSLEDQVILRDQEIMQLQLKLDDIPIDSDTSHLQMINCQATLLEEMLRNKKK